MATISEMVDIFSGWSGTRIAEGRVRARHLREAGLLPSTGRGRGAAHVNAIHCASYLISFLAAERAINGPEAVRFFSQMVPHRIRGDLTDLSDEGQRSFVSAGEVVKAPEGEGPNKDFLMPEQTFGEILAILIQWGRSRTGNGIIGRNIETIRCSRHWPSASIEIRGRSDKIIQQDYHRPPDPQQSHRMQFTFWQAASLSYPAPIMVEASVPGSVLTDLADLCGEPGRDYQHVSEVKFERQ